MLFGPIASFLAYHGVVFETLRRFWEIKEVPQKAPQNPEEHQCEEHFRTTHSVHRTDAISFDYRFKNGSSISIGESRSIAVSSYHLEQRLIRDPITISEYHEFLAEYETFGHMIKSLPTEIVKSEQTYYIPHHAVLHDSSATTRLRMVFVSCRTSNGTSLNDFMLIGPKLQRYLAIFLMQSQYRYCRYHQNVSVNLSWLLTPIPAHCVATYPWRTNHRLPLSYRYLRHSRCSLLSPSGLKSTRKRWRCRISVSWFPFYVIRHTLTDCAFGADIIIFLLVKHAIN